MISAAMVHPQMHPESSPETKIRKKYEKYTGCCLEYDLKVAYRSYSKQLFEASPQTL